MSISPLSPMHDLAAVPLAQAKGAAAERAAHAAEARAAGRRAAALGCGHGARRRAGDNDVPEDRESAERPPWQAAHPPAPRAVGTQTADDQADSALGGSLDLTA